MKQQKFILKNTLETRYRVRHKDFIVKIMEQKLLHILNKKTFKIKEIHGKNLNAL